MRELQKVKGEGREIEESKKPQELEEPQEKELEDSCGG